MPELINTNNLYVAGLPPSMDDQGLRQMFLPFGEILSAKIMLNIRTGESDCYGFVLYKEIASAQKAYELDGTVQPGNWRMMVRPARGRSKDFMPGAVTSTVFVRNLPAGVTKEQVQELFQPFGKIVQCSVNPDRHAAKMVIAHIEFTTSDEACNAMTALQKTKPFPDCQAPLLLKVTEVGRVAKKARAPSFPVSQNASPQNNTPPMQVMPQPQLTPHHSFHLGSAYGQQLQQPLPTGPVPVAMPQQLPVATYVIPGTGSGQPMYLAPAPMQLFTPQPQQMSFMPLYQPVNPQGASYFILDTSQQQK